MLTAMNSHAVKRLKVDAVGWHDEIISTPRCAGEST